ncbi:hypothetical protein G9A89_000705, partial [Geosiphon pyriformis]
DPSGYCGAPPMKLWVLEIPIVPTNEGLTAISGQQGLLVGRKDLGHRGRSNQAKVLPKIQLEGDHRDPIQLV